MDFYQYTAQLHHASPRWGYAWRSHGEQQRLGRSSVRRSSKSADGLADLAHEQSTNSSTQTSTSLSSISTSWRSLACSINFRCLVLRPETRFRHMRKLEGFICRRMMSITSGSDRPSRCLISSNETSSAQASSIVSLMSPIVGSDLFKTPIQFTKRLNAKA